MFLCLLLSLFIFFIFRFCFFFFNDTATTEIYTLSLHDALPISARRLGAGRSRRDRPPHPSARPRHRRPRAGDRRRAFASPASRFGSVAWMRRNSGKSACAPVIHGPADVGRRALATPVPQLANFAVFSTVRANCSPECI